MVTQMRLSEQPGWGGDEEKAKSLGGRIFEQHECVQEDFWRLSDQTADLLEDGKNVCKLRIN